jgi:DNA-binding transcriptional LysR family regulator
MDLNNLIIFRKVAETGSFSRAARELGLPKSSVSQKITQAEQDLGVRLLQRTTRRVSLTEVGELIFEAAGRIASEAEDIRAVAHRLDEEPRGLLRVTAPLDFGVEVIESLLPTFLARHPQISVELDLSNRVVDLVSEGFDLALRATTRSLPDSSLVGRPLLSIRMGLFASAAWLARHGTPTQIEDLRDVSALWFIAGGRRTPAVWRLQAGAKAVEVQVRAALRVNDMLAITRAAAAGLGVALLPVFATSHLVRPGELIRILPDWGIDHGEIHALYPSRKHLPAKTRAFLDHLAQAFAQEPTS